jgi:hypothetical protein
MRRGILIALVALPVVAGAGPRKKPAGKKAKTEEPAAPAPSDPAPTPAPQAAGTSPTPTLKGAGTTPSAAPTTPPAQPPQPAPNTGSGAPVAEDKPEKEMPAPKDGAESCSSRVRAPMPSRASSTRRG